MIFESYSPAGDMLTIALCFMCWAFLLCTYSKRQKNLIIFYATTVTLALVAAENIMLHWLLANAPQTTTTSYILYTLETSVYCSMTAVFLWFTAYVVNILKLTPKSKKIVKWCAIPPFVFYTIFRLVKPFMSGYIAEGKVWIYDISEQWGFLSCYIYYSFALLVILTIFKHRMSPLILKNLRLNTYISLALTIGQSFIPSTTFLSVSFMFPVITALLLFHYNPYNVNSGSLAKTSFPQYLKDNGKAKTLSMYCLKLKDFQMHDSNEISVLFLKNAEDIFKNYQTFYIDDNTIMLVFNRKNNLHFDVHESIVRRRIKLLYDVYHIPFKLTYSECDLSLLSAENYLILHQHLMSKIQWNEYRYCNYEDIAQVNRSQEIRAILQQIDKESLIDHPNIQIFCQPIWDIETQSYKSIEILSRIQHEDEIIMPDEYMPIAQYYGYTYAYNKLVFNKACAAFAELLKDEKVQLNTFSMNFTIQEFTSNNFIHDIVQIAKTHNIPCDKIAIEITESVGATASPEAIRRIIWKLKARGIKVYLDDFGVDYSNIDRVFNLPVDVIKFDKSITWAMRNDNGLKPIIASMATGFKQSGYQVLFEGVETSEDEYMCSIMNASYLQGYKFSQPIKIETLPEFLY